MIEVLGLTKLYGETTVVSGVSFSAAKGDILGFLGPNGAGKTTTMRMLVTFLPPTSGTAKIAGYDILTQAEEVRKRIGYLPENPPLYGEMRVTEYLKFMGEIKGVSKDILQSRIDEVIELCRLSDVSRKLCGHLSKGFRQRVGLAQAIIHNPEVIILDEPTSGLDPVQIIEIRKLISSLSESHTVILSTHILPEVTEVCNKVVIIAQGRVVLESSLADIVRDRPLEQAFMACVTGERVAHIG
ncbi:MAG: ATP-binding cassette domain-containing protein [bacterium]|nr:ATP-binding cassette domain-containing protein [bacterium]